jgi:Flp pilus assembly protein TadD
VRLDPNYAKAHQQLGFAFATLGQLADAERSLKKALELDPTDKITKEGLEELQQRIRQSQPAK